MARRPVAKRYAQAAFAIAQEQGRLEEGLAELQTAVDALSDSETMAFLQLPKVSLDRKLQLLRDVLKDLSPAVLNLLGLLTSKGGLPALPGVLSEYQRLLDESQGRERAEVTAALDLDEAQREKLGQLLSTLLDKEVVLTTRTDEEVLGGVLVKIGDRIIDGSARGRLRSLRQSVLATPKLERESRAMTTRGQDLAAVIKRQIEEFGGDLTMVDVGTVTEVGDGIARIHGLAGVQYTELLAFPGDVIGMAMNLEEDAVGAAIMGDDSQIKEAMKCAPRAALPKSR